MVHAVRPGGRIVIQDSDHSLLRLTPESASFAELWSAYLGTYESVGGDPYVGRRLVSMLHRAGAVPRRTATLNWGGCGGSPDFKGKAENFTDMVVGAGARIVSAGLLTKGRLRICIEELREWKYEPDAAFWFPLFWVEAVRSL